MDKETITLSGWNVNVKVNGGRLVLKDGLSIDNSRKENIVYRGICDTKHIVVLSCNGFITFDAMRWMSEQNIMVTVIDPEGNIVTNFIPENHISGVTKRRQALASSELNLKISTWLLQEKFKAQAETLKYLRDVC